MRRPKPVLLPFPAGEHEMAVVDSHGWAFSRVALVRYRAGGRGDKGARGRGHRATTARWRILVPIRFRCRKALESFGFLGSVADSRSSLYQQIAVFQ
jgi:hypothetical protein